MRYHIRIFTGLTSLALLLAAGGCYEPVNDPATSSAAPQPLVLPPAGPEHVSVDSRWAYSAYENRPAADWLLERARHTSEQGNSALDRLVRRWPDLALDLLRDSITAQSDLPLRLSIADAYDRDFDCADAHAGWSAVLTAAAAQPDAYRSFSHTRDQLLNAIHSGQFAESSKINLVAALPVDAPPALRADALRLAGLAALLNDQTDQGSALFAKAVAAAQTGPRHAQFEIGLLLSESERRRDRPDSAAAAWKAAVAVAADVRDPELWERAILAKPANVDWPPQANIAGAGEPDFAPGHSPDTGLVLIGIGKMRLSRQAPQPALLAFSRAETEATYPGEKSLAQLYRAQSMIALQQAASTIPALDTLIATEDSRIASRAQAIKGDILCRTLGDRSRGIALLREAMQNPNAGDWPGKTRLAANLGLYDLLDGDDDEGLRWLHQAEARFEVDSDWEDLAAALKNEAAYDRVADKSDQADAVQKHADEICRKAGLPAGPLVADSSSRQ